MTTIMSRFRSMVTSLRPSTLAAFLTDRGPFESRAAQRAARELRDLRGATRRSVLGSLERSTLEPRRLDAVVARLADEGADAALADLLHSLAMRDDERLLASAVESLLARPELRVRVCQHIVTAFRRREKLHPGSDRILAGRAEERILSAPSRDPETLAAQARILGQRGLTELALVVYREAYRLGGDRASVLSDAADLAIRRVRGPDHADLIAASPAGLGGEPWRPMRATCARAQAALPELARDRIGTLAPITHLIGRGWVPALEHVLEATRRVPPSYQPTERVLNVGNSLACGGMERVLATTIEHLRGKGEAIDLALLEPPIDPKSSHFLPMTTIPAEEIVDLSTTVDAIDPALALLSPSIQRRVELLSRAIRARRPRALHAHNDQTGAIAIFAALVTGCPRVLVHINHMPATPLSGRPDFAVAEPALYRRFLALPQVRVAFCSSAVADAYAEWWELERDERLHVLWNPARAVPNPIRPKAPARATLGITGDGPVVGTMFRFQDVKQPLLWAKLAVELGERRPDLRFVMIGDGPLMGAVRGFVDGAGFTDRFSFPGQVEDVFGLLAAMDLFMLTSASEGLPLSMIEAHMAGVPIATFDVGGCCEALDPERTGALVPKNDAHAMVETALRLLGDPAWLERARAEAPRFVDERFGIEQFCRRLFGFYRAS